MPKCELIKFESIDGLVLHGALFSKKNKKCIIHAHGLGGNFYKNDFIYLMAKQYLQAGLDFLTFNNRGSEFIKKIANTKTGGKKYYGYTYEIFDESDNDILGVYNFIKNRYVEINLQGHSSGCQKIMYTLYKHCNLEVNNVILISPCDDIGLAHTYIGKNKFKEKIKFASNFKGKLLPENFFFDKLISKKTFLSHFGKNNKFDIFHYYKAKKKFTEIENNKRKTLLVFGENDYFEDIKKIENIYSKFSNYKFAIIPNADHDYKNCENELANAIINFLSN